MRPSEHEEEYFARVEFEGRKKLAEERARALGAQDRGGCLFVSICVDEQLKFIFALLRIAMLAPNPTKSR